MNDFPLPAQTKQELIERVLVQRASLEALLAPVTADEMLVRRDGWSAKDHVAYLTARAGKAIAALTSQDAFEGLGLTGSLANLSGEAAIEAALHDRDRDLALEEVIEASGRRHGELLAALMFASESDLRQRTPPDEPDGRTVLAVVAANTYELCFEREARIRELLAAR